MRARVRLHAHGRAIAVSMPRAGRIDFPIAYRLVIAERGDQTGALGALLNAYRYSKDQAKTVAYFTQLAETDARDTVRRAASEAVRQVKE